MASSCATADENILEVLSLFEHKKRESQAVNPRLPIELTK